MFSSIRSAIREYVHPHSPTLVSPANTNQRQKNNKAAKLGKTAKLIPQGLYRFVPIPDKAAMAQG